MAWGHAHTHLVFARQPRRSLITLLSRSAQLNGCGTQVTVASRFKSGGFWAEIRRSFDQPHCPPVNSLAAMSDCGKKRVHLGTMCRRIGWPPRMSDGTPRNMTKTTKTGLSRRGLLTAFAATAITAAPTFSNAAGFLRGGGDIRRLRMYSGRTGESIDTIYWIEGEYIGEALHEINVFMRDWRNGKTINIDVRNIDIMAASSRILDVTEPYTLLSGYRSPETNAMLRSRSSGVARNSLHMKGQAADLRLQSRTTAQMARAARSCAAGGVGRYSGSNFVHMDCGPVRSWGG